MRRSKDLVVVLTAEDHWKLTEVFSPGSRHWARTIVRARVLLALHEAEGSPADRYRAAAERVGIGEDRASRIAKRFNRGLVVRAAAWYAGLTLSAGLGGIWLALGAESVQGLITHRASEGPTLEATLGFFLGMAGAVTTYEFTVPSAYDWEREIQRAGWASFTLPLIITASATGGVLVGVARWPLSGEHPVGGLSSWQAYVAAWWLPGIFLLGTAVLLVVVGVRRNRGRVRTRDSDVVS